MQAGDTLLSIAAQDPRPTTFLDIGPGKVLANMARKTVPDIPALNLDDANGQQAFAIGQRLDRTGIQQQFSG